MPPFRRRGPDQICGGLANSRAAGVITAAQPREKAARVSASGLVDPTLGYPARGPASWRCRPPPRPEILRAAVSLTNLLTRLAASVAVAWRLAACQPFVPP